MKILLAPFGSRGDVDPLLALGQELRDRGCSVSVCAPLNFVDSAVRLGFDFHPVPIDFRDYFRRGRGEVGVLIDVFRDVALQFRGVEGAARDADVIIGSMLQLAAPSVAEVTGARYYYAMFSPLYLRTTDLAPLAFPYRRAPRWVSKMIWMAQDLSVPVFARALNRERARLGLESIRSVYEYLSPGGAVLLACDEQILPAPPEAGEVQVTGAWRIRDDEALDPRIADWLEGRSRAIWIGFGSMRHRNPEKPMRIVIDASRQAAASLIVGSGWSGMTAREDDVLVVEEAPHSALFPQLAAVAHHGGIGTVTAAARAGIPQIVVPHVGDQFGHGFRVEDLGIGPAPIPLRQLTVEKLVAAFRSVLDDPQWWKRASEFSRVPFLDGTRLAADIVLRSRS